MGSVIPLDIRMAAKMTGMIMAAKMAPTASSSTKTSLCWVTSVICVICAAGIDTPALQNDFPSGEWMERRGA